MDPLIADAARKAHQQSIASSKSMTARSAMRSNGRGDSVVSAAARSFPNNNSSSTNDAIMSPSVKEARSSGSGELNTATGRAPTHPIRSEGGPVMDPLRDPDADLNTSSVASAANATNISRANSRTHTLESNTRSGQRIAIAKSRTAHMGHFGMEAEQLIPEATAGQGVAFDDEVKMLDDKRPLSNRAQHEHDTSAPVFPAVKRPFSAASAASSVKPPIFKKVSSTHQSILESASHSSSEEETCEDNGRNESVRPSGLGAKNAKHHSLSQHCSANISEMSDVLKPTSQRNAIQQTGRQRGMHDPGEDNPSASSAGPASIVESHFRPLMNTSDSNVGTSNHSQMLSSAASMNSSTATAALLKRQMELQIQQQRKQIDEKMPKGASQMSDFRGGHLTEIPRQISDRDRLSYQTRATAHALGLSNKTNAETLQNILPFRTPTSNLPPHLEKRLPLEGPVFVSSLVRKVYECKRMSSPHKSLKLAKKITRDMLLENGVKVQKCAQASLHGPMHTQPPLAHAAGSKPPRARTAVTSSVSPVRAEDPKNAKSTFPAESCEESGYVQQEDVHASLFTAHQKRVRKNESGDDEFESDADDDSDSSNSIESNEKGKRRGRTLDVGVGASEERGAPAPLFMTPSKMYVKMRPRDFTNSGAGRSSILVPHSSLPPAGRRSASALSILPPQLSAERHLPHSSNGGALVAYNAGIAFQQSHDRVFEPFSFTTAPILEQLTDQKSRPVSRMLAVKANTEASWSLNPQNKHTTKTTLLDGTVITTAAKRQEKRLSGTVYRSALLGTAGSADPLARGLPTPATTSPAPEKQMEEATSLHEDNASGTTAEATRGDRKMPLRPFEVAQFDRRFDDVCENIDTDIQQYLNERSAASGKMEAAVFVVTRLIRPLYGKEGKRKKEGNGKTFVLSFRLHLRALLRWAIGRVIIQLREKGVQSIKIAKQHLDQLRAEKKKKDEQEHYQARVRGATQLLEEVADVIKLTKQQLKAREALLTADDEVYCKLRKRFEYLCGTDRMVLSLFELQEMASNSGTDFDVKLFRRIDLDRGGYLEFDEIVRALYPTIPMKTLRNLMRRYDEENGMQSTWRKKISAENAKAALIASGHRRSGQRGSADDGVGSQHLQLTPESKEQVILLFQATDQDSKGYVTRSDMIRQFIMPTEDPNLNEEDRPPIPKGPFWFDAKFPKEDSIVSLAAFTEMVKFAFPPFKHVHSNPASTYVYKPPPASILPAEIVELQRKLLTRPGYVQ